MWDYKKTDTNSIKKALKQVNCESLFLNKTVHEQVLISNKTLLNVLSNHVPNKIFTISDKDLLWMTQYLKSQINWHNNVYQEYHRKRNHSADDFIFLENVISEVSDLIFSRKNVYYNQLAQKLNDPKTSSKTYWSILKTFYNGKKVPLIPPLFINNKLEQDLKLKDNFFNKSFADKCTPIQNNSVIPNFIECESMHRLTSIVCNDESILNIIRALDVNKAHGHDDISIRMIRLCDKSFIINLSLITPLIYKNCINSGIFLYIWKKFNVAPVHKKGYKQVVNNYRPVSLLSIFGKILEKLIFNSLFEFLH